jgi:hypothetical protein
MVDINLDEWLQNEWLKRFAGLPAHQPAAPELPQTPAPVPPTARKRRPARYEFTVEEQASLNRITSPTARLTAGRLIRDRRMREKLLKERGAGG